MHELSIAKGIIDIVREAVPEKNTGRVTSVHVKVGASSGVVPECLDFSFTALVAGSPLAQVQLNIELVPFAAECLSCKKSFENTAGLVVCPECGGRKTRVISGIELHVTEIELTDIPQDQPLEVP
jgi:hydrogenase nickel incorporation protein HypA/HybF